MLQRITTGMLLLWLFTGTALAAPTVSLTAPTDNASVIAPDTVTLQAEASDSDGTITQVEFYEGATLLATDTDAPYNYAWSTAQTGSYTLFAKAINNLGASTTSTAVHLTVAANQAPTVSITAPAPNTSYTTPASIHLTASATDADGSITQVAFYQSGQLLTTLTTAPYAYDWTGVQPGSYQLTAQATDDRGLTTTSSALTLTVTTAIPQAYYIHTDQLDTPRAITDQANTIVWRWDSDPFGATPANEGPDGNSTPFEFNQRFPGQYADKETSLHYNYHRSYDPQTGRYIESDPIGLAAGQFSTYTYVEGNPISYSDFFGLAVYDDGGTRLPVGRIPGGGGGGRPGSSGGSSIGGTNSSSISLGKPVGGSGAGRPNCPPPKKAPDFVVSPNGTTYPVPNGAQGPTPVVNQAGKQTGSAYTGGTGGANGQVDTMRIMDSTPPRGSSPGYPNGYIKYENANGQGVNPITGRTIPNSQSHYPIE